MKSANVAKKVLKNLYPVLPAWVNEEKFYEEMIPLLQVCIRCSKTGAFTVPNQAVIPLYPEDLGEMCFDSDMLRIHLQIIESVTFSCDTGEPTESGSGSESTDDEN